MKQKKENKKKVCGHCGKEPLTSYIRVYGDVTVIRKTDPYPFGLKVVVGNGFFCDFKCYRRWLMKMYDPKKEGWLGGEGWGI